MTTLIKVNLLPPGERKATSSPIEQFYRTPLMWILIAAMVLIVVLLSVPIHFRKQQLAELQAKVALLEPKQEIVTELVNMVKKSEARRDAFKGLVDINAWSKRLNALSDLTPDGVWFTELTISPQKGLLIQGSVISQGGTEMVKVGRFVADLKGDSTFLSSLRDLQIESIKRVHQKEIEIVQFTLTGRLDGPAK